MNTKPPRLQTGYTTIPVVAAIATVMLSSMVFVFRSNNWSQEIQSKAQVSLDYTQKEEAILRALINIVPNKAIGAMQDGSATADNKYTWETIFREAIDLADADTAVSAAILNRMGISPDQTAGTGYPTGPNDPQPTVISGNSGDTSFTNASQIVSSVVGSSSLVNPGNTRESALFLSEAIADKLPAPLYSSFSEYNNDKVYPIISLNKVHSSSWTKGLELSPNSYPLYNLYKYPNIRFGYARPGDLFVAKRNWWTFSLKFGSGVGQGANAAPPIKKNYVLSIYEVPSQLPASAYGLMSVGQHADGTAWRHASLSGGFFAGRLETQGTVALPTGLFSARKSTNFSAETTVAGAVVGNNFDDLGVREQREAQTGSDFYDASVSGNVGRVAFIPINRGQAFLELNTDGSQSGRLSSTGWNEYSCGATQAAMRIEVRNMTSTSVQMPTSIRFYYKTSSGSTTYRTYTRGSSTSPWPTDAQSGGTAIPFQTDYLDIQRNALVLNLDRLPAFLASIGAANTSINNSIYIYPNSSRSTVNAPHFPSISSDPAVSLRGGRDLSPFSKGLSVVTNLRLYLADSLNTVAVPIPSGSGLAAGTTFYPPISLFAPEKRFGETIEFENPVQFSGQVQSLSKDETAAFHPLDLKAGNGDDINADKINANLKIVRSPAELPPIHLMNWLVTIKEIH